MTRYKTHQGRPVRKGYRGTGHVSGGAYGNPRLDPLLKQIFRKIGVPEPAPFRPDPFQREALERLEDDDVLVSAPTGTGKTWIASQATSQYLLRGRRIWYASPLKALSNAIYAEFCHDFGHESCGILTGDRKENPTAPILVGTTEILRNQLYDAMQEGTNIQADLVILDEAHYLSDPDRGVVWEEVLIYLPPRVRLLLLSATISNAEEICAWLQENRRRKACVIRSHERPVSLEMLFIFPDGHLAPLGGKRGLTPRVKKFVFSQRMGRGKGLTKIHYGDLIRSMRNFDLLPAIFFLKSRMDCNSALLSCPRVVRSPEVDERFRHEVRTFLQDFPHLEGHRHLSPLLDSAVGAHHAGQLPYWKLLIEKMMNRGYLEAIFSTSTVAAGVNFPARTVVLVQSDRYDGHEFTNLTATELHQMIGRAGRRGKDNIGFALIVPGLHQDPQLIYELKDSLPEPLMSQIRINFSMTLNLLLSHPPSEIKDLLERSFASFQEKRVGSDIQRGWEAMLDLLKRALPEGQCDVGDPHEVLENIQKRSELRKEIKRLSEEIREEELMTAYREYLKPGRLFLHKNKDVYVVFHTYLEHGKLQCAAHNIQKSVKMRRRKIHYRKVPLEKIKGVFDYRLDLPEDYSAERLQRLFHSIKAEDLELINLSITEEEGQSQIEKMRARLERLPCEECAHFKDCHMPRNRELGKILKEFRSLAFQMEGIGGGLWISFKRHLRFLKETGFVDEGDRLTPDGYWASKLRLDHPLLIAEVIRKGGFSGISPEVMAGCLAPFVWDRVQEIELKGRSPLDLGDIVLRLESILNLIQGIRTLKMKRGFENPPILFWPAAALYLWAKGVSWDHLLFFVHVDEGDMASLVMRTADHLRQVTNLEETHPELAAAATKAIDLIIREPVYIP